MTDSNVIKPATLVFALLIFPVILNAQKEKEQWNFEAGITWGNLLRNKDPFLDNSYSAYGVDLRAGIRTTGKKEWQQWLKYPDYGVGLRYVDFAQRDLGQSIALFGYISSNFLTYKNFSLRYGLGLGAMYWTKPYDPVENPHNRYIGSKINAYIELCLGGEFKLSERTDLGVRFNFYHSSNGSTCLPNKGINVVAAHIGLRYHLYNRKPNIYTLDTIRTFRAVNSIHIQIAPGFRESSHDHKLYPKYGLQIGYSRLFHPCFRFGGGFDFNYSGELALMLPAQERAISKYFNAAAFAGFEIIYGRVGIHVALGSYFYKSFKYYTLIYERAGVRIFLGKKMDHYLGIAVKAHGAVADYIEWSYGFHFLHWDAKKARPVKKYAGNN